MFFLTICLLCLLGVSLFVFAGSRKKPTSVRSAYGSPPVGWPDVPVSALGLFQREGRINALPHTPAKSRLPCAIREGPPRVNSFRDAQTLLVGMVNPRSNHTPKIGLKLSAQDGPDWTDVFFDGDIVARIPTQELAQSGGMRPS
ncbi:hypothetical protein MWU54_09520 [Marivita sp. S6314]|uniref:hypothetical protein n=1 Tax=Marivita sp. S6314 TaxID=2926406 RepID=UPI001FF24E1F|nr:hypothetical protein [Marivita sp. S6314]MCK0150259.1 hypothetical protein [Marivita sp. S6314]